MDQNTPVFFLLSLPFLLLPASSMAQANLHPPAGDVGAATTIRCSAPLASAPIPGPVPLADRLLLLLCSGGCWGPGAGPQEAVRPATSFFFPFFPNPLLPMATAAALTVLMSRCRHPSILRWMMPRAWR